MCAIWRENETKIYSFRFAMLTKVRPYSYYNTYERYDSYRGQKHIHLMTQALAFRIKLKSKMYES